MLTRKVLPTAVVVAVVLAGLFPTTPATAAEPCDAGPVDETYETWLARCGLDVIIDEGSGPGTCLVSPGTSFESPVACVHPDFGWWSNSLQCYLSPVTPQPPPDDAAWGDDDPDEGLLYEAACPFLQGVDGYDWTDPYLLGLRFVPLAADPIGAIVQQVIGSLELSGPDIHMAPDPEGAGLVGLPVWMWTPETPTTWDPAPLELSLDAFGVTLVVTPVVDQIVWDMGDGRDPKVCETPGTPYDPSYGLAPSPDCGYVYWASSRDQPDGRYQVTAVTTWVITWELEGTGLGATITTERESATSVQINELQVLTTIG